MRKITRSLTVIGSAAALTLAGTGVATAQMLSSDVFEQSSRILDPDGFSTAERALYNAGVKFGNASTGKSGPTLNANAKNGTWTGNNWIPGPTGLEGRYYPTDAQYVVIRTTKANHQTLVDYLNTNSLTVKMGKNYGVHPSTSGDHYYVSFYFN